MLDFIIGLVVATLSGMGVGSGGLLVVYLTALSDVGQLAAQGINLFFFLFSSGASTAVNLRRRRIAWGQVLILGVTGALTAVAGSLLASATDPALIRRVFGGMLIAAGAPSLVSGARRLLRRRG